MDRLRRNSDSLRALDLLTEYPVLTVTRLANLLDVTLPQASQAIGQLVGVGILRERTGYSRNRVFAAEEIVAIANRPFGEEAGITHEAGGADDPENDGLEEDAPRASLTP